MLSIWNRCLNATRRLGGSGLVRLFFLPLMWDQGSYQHRSTEQQISCMQGDWGGMWLASTNQKFTNSTCSLRFVHKLHQASRWQPRSYHPEKPKGITWESFKSCRWCVKLARASSRRMRRHSSTSSQRLEYCGRVWQDPVVWLRDVVWVWGLREGAWEVSQEHGRAPYELFRRSSWGQTCSEQADTRACRDVPEPHLKQIGMPSLGQCKPVRFISVQSYFKVLRVEDSDTIQTLNLHEFDGCEHLWAPRMAFQAWSGHRRCAVQTPVGFDHGEPRDAASGHCVFEAPAHLFLQEGTGCGLRTVCTSFEV